jgi:peptide-methionine (R)-S-oxide reductase
MKTNALGSVLLLILPCLGCSPTVSRSSAPVVGRESNGGESVEKLHRTDAEWRQLLVADVFHVMREKGTERAFTGKYAASKQPGSYRCAACGLELFASTAKFDSGTGWPSFWQPIAPAQVETEIDHSFGVRTEVLCARCGGHLGHVFDDGPAPTGLRYCINSLALDFTPAAAKP